MSSFYKNQPKGGFKKKSFDDDGPTPAFAYYSGLKLKGTPVKGEFTVNLLINNDMIDQLIANLANVQNEGGNLALTISTKFSQKVRKNVTAVFTSGVKSTSDDRSYDKPYKKKFIKNEDIEDEGDEEIDSEGEESDEDEEEQEAPKAKPNFKEKLAKFKQIKRG